MYERVMIGEKKSISMASDSKFIVFNLEWGNFLLLNDILFLLLFRYSVFQ